MDYIAGIPVVNNNNIMVNYTPFFSVLAVLSKSV